MLGERSPLLVADGYDEGADACLAEASHGTSSLDPFVHYSIFVMPLKDCTLLYCSGLSGLFQARSSCFG